MAHDVAKEFNQAGAFLESVDGLPEELPYHHHSPARLFDWNRAGEDFDLSLAHANRVLEQSARRRTGGHAAVGIVDASMTGTHEEVGLRQPSHRTSEMRTVDREGDKAAGLHAPQPRRRHRAHSRPGHRRRVEKADAHGLAGLEAVD